MLLVKRTPQARFMGGVWVFPGGAVDAGEGEGDAAHRVAAVRELEEEAGIVVDDPDALVQVLALDHTRRGRDPLRHALLPAPPPDGQQPTIDGQEIVDQGWFTPAAALDAPRARRHRAGLPDDQAPRAALPFESADALLDYAHGREVGPVQPRVVKDGETARVVLPGEPGYDDTSA